MSEKIRVRSRCRVRRSRLGFSAPVLYSDPLHTKAMNEPPIYRPAMGPAAAGGGVIAGLSAAIVALFLIFDCYSFRTRKDECRETMQIGVPAVVAGFASVLSAWGGFWTKNPALHSSRKEPRRRDEHGRYLPDLD